ncbi:MAG: hypothetical protein ACFE9S_07055 [Candidatus Hermodarchaeota archaeon]
MELFQVFWDDEKKLFLEFKKDEDEKQIYLPHNIRRINVQFEISKKEVFYKEPPYLISIKKLYHSGETLAFTIDLDLINTIEDLQIKILRIYIFLNSGQRIEHSFRETFKASDIEFNNDCYLGFEFEDLNKSKNLRSTYTQEKIYEEIKTDFNKSEQKRTVVYEKRKIENLPENLPILAMVNESNKTLKNIEEQIKNLAVILKSMSFNNVQYTPQIPIKRSQEPGIERIKSPPSNFSLLPPGAPSAKILVIKEMKSIFQTSIDNNNEFNIKDILKPMSEEELKSITLSHEILMEKEQKAIENQIKRLKNKQEKQLALEDLKKPK